VEFLLYSGIESRRCDWHRDGVDIFKGATVEEVFDDLTQEEFAEKHQINAEIYHNVEPAETLREGDNPSKTA